MKIANFIVPGRAIPAVRMTQRSKYTKYAQRYLAYKQQVGWAAKEVYKGEPVTGDVAVKISFYIYGKKYGDIDNMFKGITDSLNKIIYEDDRQIKLMKAEIIACDRDKERSEVEVIKL